MTFRTNRWSNFCFWIFLFAATLFTTTVLSTGAHATGKKRNMTLNGFAGQYSLTSSEGKPLCPDHLEIQLDQATQSLRFIPAPRCAQCSTFKLGEIHNSYHPGEMDGQKTDSFTHIDGDELVQDYEYVHYGWFGLPTLRHAVSQKIRLTKESHLAWEYEMTATQGTIQFSCFYAKAAR